MLKKPIIGIICRKFIIDGESVFQLNTDYYSAIVKNGGIPLGVFSSDYCIQNNNSNFLSDESISDLDNILSKCNGILMTGGYNWNKCDEYILEYALKNDIPILGICLGMQIMGSMDFFNSDMPDRTIRNDTIINHFQKGKQYVHKCKILDGLLYKILKKNSIVVNSRHNYHIEDRKYFNIDAYSEDGLIEAISIENHKFALGVQWHPESMIDYDEDMFKIFKAFIEASIQS